MLTVAIQQALKIALAPDRVFVVELPDFVAGQGPTHAVYVAADGDDPLYQARIQIRSRAGNIVAAEEAGLRALAAIVSMRYSSIAFDDPRDPPGVTRQYDLQYIEIVGRPTYFPTGDPGYEVSANYRAFVKNFASPGSPEWTGEVVGPGFVWDGGSL